jgi:acetoin utilization deacetylase AcuC-like enzyme
MARTGVVIDPRYMDHDTGAGHPERPERIGVLLPLIEALGTDVTRVQPRPASPEDLALVHDPAYIEEVAATQDKPGFAFDADTPTAPRSYATACLAAGGFLALLDAVMSGEVENGFALVRPPGHHAERDQAMGFCLFNNIAVGAQYLRRRYGLERVLIVDWDLHHGNGTQHLFESDAGVLYVSTHQYPYYPGTGDFGEVGHEEGEGYTVNLPFPAGFGDAEYREAFESIIEPIARQYDPEFVLISAGFDAHARDPLGGMMVTETGFGALGKVLLDIARDHSRGRCAAVLEGGYDLIAIRDSVRHVLAEFHGSTAAAPPVPPPSHSAAIIERIKKTQRRFWKL